MISSKVSCLTLLVVLGVATTAMAGTVTVVQTPNPGTGSLANTVTNDILIDSTPGQQILSQQLRLVLQSGSVFNAAVGSSNTSAPSSGLFGFFPDLPFDSFISAGSYTSETGPSPTVVGKSDLFGGPGGVPAQFDAQLWDVTFGPVAGQDTVNKTGYLAARLTLSNTANGIFNFRSGFADNPESMNRDVAVVNGVIMLGGVVGAPDIDVLGNGISIADGDLTPSLLDNTNFGNVALGSNQTRAFSITNTGTADLTLSGLNVAGGFQLVGAFPGTIAPAASQVFTIGITNTAALGARAGSVSFGTNVDGLATYNFDLAGNVVPEPASLTLFGLALVGMIGLVRRRS